MKTRKLIADIEKWLADFDEDGNKGASYYDNDTIEGGAYNLLVRALKVLRKNNKIDNEMKRHSKGMEKAITEKD